VPIVLDRRIDPELLVSVQVEDSELVDVLQEIAAAHGWQVGVLPDVVYVGPTSSASPLASWYVRESERLAALPAPVRNRWRRPSDASWPEITEPRALVERWLQQARVACRDTKMIPHDLWPAQALPRLDLLQRLTLVLAGFQLAPHVADDGSLEIVPLPPTVELTREYAIPARNVKDLDSWQQQLADARFIRDGARLQLTGRVEDHRRLASWLQDNPNRTRIPSRPGQKRFTLNVKNQRIDAVLLAVAQQTDLQVVWPEGSDELQATRVSLSVDNATLGELLSQLLRAQGAEFRIQNGRLQVQWSATRRQD
jgi:hypothetical protein